MIIVLLYIKKNIQLVVYSVVSKDPELGYVFKGPGSKIC